METLNYEQLQVRCEELQQQLQYYREYDSLTGLLNKTAFYLKVKGCLAREQKQQYNIVCVDVERFRVVNDLYGTGMGDNLLIYLAAKISTFWKEEAVCARLAADVFGLLLPAGISFQEIELAILRIFKMAPLEMEISPAIGIYQVDNTELPAEQMCDRAILALESIKGNYLKHFAVYRERLREHLLEEQELINRADAALQKGEFEIYMQPKCKMQNGKLVGAEALVRWNHPIKGMVSPALFIPLFERNGFIKRLDAYVWEEVVKWLRCWLDEGRHPVPISVNVSRMDIIGMDLFETLQGILKKYQVPTELLEVEITESAYTSRFEEIINTVERLMHSGYTVLMDDFGSGYSSLNMLKDINVNILKLDLHFLDNADKKSRDILTSIVHMASWLDLRVIAEGVENKSQVDFLKAIGCEYAQGYYYYRPMPLAEFQKLLSKGGNIDFQDRERSQSVKENLIKFNDLFHEDMMTDRLLNNIMGGIALFQYDGSILKTFRCNSEYYWMMFRGDIPVTAGEQNFLELLEQEEYRVVKEALKQAKSSGDRGVEINIRRKGSNMELRWLKMRLFYLSERNGQSLYYAGFSDVTKEMRNIEELRLSDQQFRAIMEASGNTLFELDIETRVARYAHHSQQEFGLSDSVANAPEGFIEQGAVCEPYIGVFCDMYDAIYRGEEKASCIIQACLGDNSIVWNQITLVAIKDDSGKSVKAIGLVERVTNEIMTKEKPV